jgi:hypothetical protein
MNAEIKEEVIKSKKINLSLTLREAVILLHGWSHRPTPFEASIEDLWHTYNYNWNCEDEMFETTLEDKLEEVIDEALEQEMS